MSSIDRDGYRRDGFVVVRNLLPVATVQACLEELAEMFSEVAVAHGVSGAKDASMAEVDRVMTELFRRDLPAYLAAAKLAQLMIPLHSLGCDPGLMTALRALGLAKPIISTKPFLFMVGDNIRVPGGYGHTPPHQDFRSIQGSLDSVVVWTPFCRVDKDNQPIEVCPGSHRLGLLLSEEDAFGHRVAAEAAPREGWIPVEADVGDAVIFSTLLVHRSSTTGAGRIRIAASLRYNNRVEPSFVERLYPNPYLYKPNYALDVSGVATRERVEAVFAG
jgi:ectoine hydroxylase-related dioxygenase (phytanoyl-CoA dioxygenase family)